jgi:hypothetical protein
MPLISGRNSVKMKNALLILFAVSLSMSLPAQEVSTGKSGTPSNGIVVNFLGDGSDISLNYERLIRFGEYFFISGSLGIGYGRQMTLNTPGSDTILAERPAYMTIPAHISFNAGKKRHFAEAALCSTLAIGNVDPHLLYFVSAGYRFEPLRSGNLSIRIYKNWLLNDRAGLRNIFFVPFGGSLGFVF